MELQSLRPVCRRLWWTDEA